jgi:hypothetical protein
MVSIYSTKRKEPRVKLHTKVRVAAEVDGRFVSVDTTTIDVSPNGASVHLETPFPLGTVVTFASTTYHFETRAVIRAVVPDRMQKGYTVGLEYLDKKNPIVVWQKKQK